jgi:predicted metalloprotease
MVLERHGESLQVHAMRWRRGGVSSDLEDRRGMSLGGRGLKLGLGGTLVVGLLSLLLGTDLFAVIGGSPAGTGTGGDPGPAQGAPVEASPAEQERVEFVSFVLDDLQSVWSQALPRYERAKLVLFRDAVQSGCGVGESATGPFYCPLDGKVYLDLGFFDELSRRLGAPGEFAQAYVIAHEIGHHVQHVLGISDEVRRAQEGRPAQRNALSVRLELQADCFAGVWAHSTSQRDLLERGDVEAAMNAAAAIGDDRLQRSATGRVAPESFTHGSSAQRVEWFRRGAESGNLDACDTFAAR